MRTGRPKLDHPRDANRRIRLTHDEDALITAAAEKAGQPVAAWCRDKLIAAAKRTR